MLVRKVILIAMNNELYFEGKKYISAKRASELSGYNSDYIGQLCRGNKIDARRVGRGWFIGENSILEHKKNASEKVRGTISFPPTVSHYFDSISEKVNTPDPSHLSLSSIFDPKLKQALFYLALVPFVSAIFFLVSISYNKSFQANVAVVSEKIVSFQQNLVANTASHVTDYVTLVDQSPDASSVNKTSFVIGKIFGSIAKSFNRLALGTYRFVSALFNFDTVNTFVMRDTNHFDGVADTGATKDLGDGRIGIVTSPSTGNAMADERLKQKIKDSFSDETKVYPDDTGTSGVIKPVFKKSSDQDYLYVVVPVSP